MHARSTKRRRSRARTSSSCIAESEGPTQTRVRLLHAAVRVFAERGFRAATVRQICKLARANIAAVSYHFGSKKALYEAAVESLFRLQEPDGDPSISPLTEPEGPPALRLEALLRDQLRVIHGGTGASAVQRAAMLLKEFAFPSAQLKRIAGGQIGPLLDRLVGLILEYLPLRGGDPRLDAIVACIMGPILFPVYTAQALSRAGLEVPSREDLMRSAELLPRFVVAGLPALVEALRHPAPHAAPPLG